MSFVPFDVTDEEASDWKVLRPGVPPTMRPALITWLWKSVQNKGSVYPSKLHTWSNALDIDFSLNPEYSGLLNQVEFRKFLMRISDRDLLRLIDYRLYEDSYGADATGLSEILVIGRSKYHVVKKDGGARLATRVPEGVQVAAETVMSAKSPAGELLSKAWNAVYDLEPNDSAAYAYAVRAVESASFVALQITDSNATLGHSIRTIEKADANWRLPFLREHSQFPSKELLVGMLKSLYKGQRDRHGSEAYSDVTHDEAEGAVLLAVTIVGWFARGLVVEREEERFG
ncbi:hypothetical protein [Aeromicrobium terrae]|uniref:TIGR02391 family protein n=1 Tax=Aeromicrobium terrae TaxID=2498846 RepID=A0A5C8NIY7_9ACTN|nr:hypothetical protein [Aeromicrobium terrae]TXL60845.1 hypothetical protein FHP06_10505 [Aeromicrobium terrae]